MHGHRTSSPRKRRWYVDPIKKVRRTSYCSLQPDHTSAIWGGGNRRAKLAAEQRVIVPGAGGYCVTWAARKGITAICSVGSGTRRKVRCRTIACGRGGPLAPGFLAVPTPASEGVGAIRFGRACVVNGKYQKRLTSEHQKLLDALRRGEADTAEQVAKSQEAIEDSLALLRRSESIGCAEA
jgi:hypothetical protein